MSLLDRLRAAGLKTTDPDYKFSALDRLGRTSVAVPEHLLFNAEPRASRLGKQAVGPSRDLARILELPRRKIDVKDPSAAEKWTALLRRFDNDGTCDCIQRWGFCLKKLLPIQGWMLEEAHQTGGLLGLMAVGSGKTAGDILLPMVVPDCQRVVLLLQSNLKAQFLERDYPQWSMHFKTPQVAGGRFFTAGVPIIHVIAYSELSSAKSTDLLKKITPDTIIADECFPGDAMVLTDAGNLPIAQVHAGAADQVAAWDGQKFTWRRIVHRIQNKRRAPLVQIQHTQGKCICTPNHRVWTEDRGYVRADELRPGDLLRVVPEALPKEEAGERIEVLQQGLRQRDVPVAAGLRSRDGGEAVCVLQKGVLGDEEGEEHRSFLQSELCLDSEQQSPRGTCADQRPAESSLAVPGFSCPSQRSAEASGGSGVRKLQEGLGAAQSRVAPQQQEIMLAVRQSAGGSQGHCRAEGEEVPGVCPVDAVAQSNAEPGDGREDASVLEGANLPLARGQQQDHRPAAEGSRALPGTDGVRDSDQGGTRCVPVAAHLLQGGCRVPRGEAGRGDRREVPQVEEVDLPRPAEDFRSGVSRVEGVEVLERGSGSEPTTGSGDDYVYNLEVEGLHNYVANGIVVSNCHNLRRRDAARTKRFLRHFSENPKTRLCGLSGTLTSRSLEDYAHLAKLALGEGSPLPLHWPTVEEWAGAIDAERPNTIAAPIGALRKLCEPGENIRSGFQRRLNATKGVVATAEGLIGTSLVLNKREPAIPPEVAEALHRVRLTWARPDGEELTDAMTKAAVCRQLACGFYYRWIWPRKESKDTIEAWLFARKDWHREVREKLKHSREFMDSPLLVTKAAMRWFDGFTDEEGKIHAPETRHRLTWEAKSFPAWRQVKDTCEPQTEAVWVSDYLAHDASEWGKAEPGIIWYEHDAWGRKVAEISGLPFYGAGAEASSKILQERGGHSIIASTRAHGTGKNLQCFCRNLVVSPPSSGKDIEQLLGRTHRQGQRADEVLADFYLHTTELQESLAQAERDSHYIQDSTGSPMRLLYAARTWH